MITRFRLRPLALIYSGWRTLRAQAVFGPLGDRHWVAALGLSGSALLASNASAQEAPQDPNDLFTPQVGINLAYDDNLFRLPGNESVPAFLSSSSKSDWERTENVGFTLDKVYGLQRFTVVASVAQTTFSTYNYLNYVAVNGNAVWTWAVTPDVTGHLLYTRAQSLNSFSNFTTFGRNINTSEDTRADADWRLGGEFHLGAALYQTTQENTLPVYDFENARINSFEPNFSFESAAGNSFGIYGRISRGHYIDQTLDIPEQLDTAFTEHEAGFRVSYGIDGQTSLFGQLGVVSRQNSHFADRNFNSLEGQFKWDWTFTGKLGSEVVASRSVGAYLQTVSSYVATDKVSVGPTWAATAKTSFTAGVQETEYQFGGPIAPVPSLRTDHIAGLFVTGSWKPVREVEITLRILHTTRRSNYPDLGFVDNTSMIGAKFSF